jgi:hypothetical protein
LQATNLAVHYKSQNLISINKTKTVAFKGNNAVRTKPEIGGRDCRTGESLSGVGFWTFSIVRDSKAH